MIADTAEELHAMADRIGVARRWFQDTSKASFPHYDIAKSKRALAVAAGAIECDRTAFVGHIRRLRVVYGVYGPGNPAPKEPIDELIERSSIGAAMRDIKERGIDAHLADLERETTPKRRRR